MAWRRGQALSEDLRARVLARVDEGVPVYEAAEVFGVSVSYIYKALGRRRETGEVTARAQRSHQPRVLEPYHEALRARVAAVPDATIEEMREWLRRTHGVAASAGGMWNTLTRLGLTHKKSHSTRRSRRGLTWPRREPPGASGNHA